MHREDHARVAYSMGGVVFLGTPHQGILNSAAFSTLGQLYRGIARTKIPIKDNVLHTMANENEVLVKVVHDFSRTIRNQTKQGNGPQIFCFFETQPIVTDIDGAKVVCILR
jgi:hypothetical protein